MEVLGLWERDPDFVRFYDKLFLIFLRILGLILLKILEDGWFRSKSTQNEKLSFKE